MPSTKRGPKDKLLAKNALALQNTHTLAANLHIALLCTLVSVFYGGYALSPAGTTELPLYVVTADNPVRAGGPPYPLSSVRSVRVSTVQTLQLPSLLGAIFLLSSAEHAFYAATCRSYYRGFLHARVNPVRWAVQASALPLAASVHVYFCGLVLCSEVLVSYALAFAIALLGYWCERELAREHGIGQPAVPFIAKLAVSGFYTLVCCRQALITAANNSMPASVVVLIIGFLLLMLAQALPQAIRLTGLGLTSRAEETLYAAQSAALNLLLMMCWLCMFKP